MFSKQTLKRIFNTCAKITIVAILLTLFVLRVIVDLQLIKHEINEEQVALEIYKQELLSDIEKSIPLMNQVGIMISERKINITDAYSILTSSDPQASWSIYTATANSIMGDSSINIDETNELKIKTDGIYGEVLSLCVRKQFTPSCFKDIPKNTFIVDTKTGKYFEPSTEAHSDYTNHFSVTNPNFGAYPDYFKNYSDIVYYTDAPVPGTSLILRRFMSRSELSEQFDEVSKTLNWLTLILTVFITYMIIHMSLMSTDISKSEEIQREKEAAERASNTKNLFLANMSHEIRTPLNSILGLNELIYQESSESIIKEYSGSIRTAGSNLLSLINDILDFSKIEEGSLTLVESNFQLSRMLTELYTVFKYKADEKGLELIFEINPNIPEYLKGDNIRFEQVLSNLLSNAIKYTDKGKVIFSMNWSNRTDNTVTIIARVQDTGRGMKEESLSEIFNKFTRVDMVANNSIEGTGLGLAITKEIIDAMGGKIDVESIYGSGSIFTVEVPQQVLLMKPIGDFTPRIENETTDTFSNLYAPDAKILIVDDTVLNLKVTKKLLEPTGMQIDIASSGLECISRMEQTSYDIVLMDDRMPQMDGVETLQRLMKIDSIQHKIEIGKIRVIMMTANVVSGAKEYYAENGFTDYLPKPVSPNILFNTIKMYLPPSLVKERVDVPVSEESATKDQLRKIKGLNLEDGIKACSDMNVYIEALEEFTAMSSELIHDVREYVATNDIGNATIKFHSLKSSSKLIGALDLSEKAKRLEEAGNTFDIDYINKNTDSLLKDLGQISLKIKTALVSEASLEEGEQIDDDAVMNIFSHMYSYVVDFNDEALNSMVKALSKYKFPKPYDSYFKDIKEFQKKADWEGLFNVFNKLGFEE